jgi:pectinesterase
MDNYNIPHEFVLMPNANYPSWNMREWFIPTLDAVDNFLKKHLKKK